MSKRAGRTGGEDVPRKFRKLSVEEEDEERTVKEEESESDSESETERGLLASRSEFFIFKSEGFSPILFAQIPLNIAVVQ